MTVPESLPDAALAEYIVDRYHEAHRRDLPAILALAEALAARGAGDALALRLKRMADDLEAHMFKEEMRLFPMIEQGGGALVGHLVDDMVGEHRMHEDSVAEVRALLADFVPPPDGAADVSALRAAVEALFADLAEHVRIEDEVLFARFGDAPRAPIVG
jgi:regulator of cell morphogenesis and NO signaling